MSKFEKECVYICIKKTKKTNYTSIKNFIIGIKEAIKHRL